MPLATVSEIIFDLSGIAFLQHFTSKPGDFCLRRQRQFYFSILFENAVFDRKAFAPAFHGCRLEKMTTKGIAMRGLRWAQVCLWATIFSLFWLSTAANAQEVRAPSSGQTIYLPIYSHMLYGNVGKSGKASQVLLSALVSIRNTDGRRPLRILSARYYDTLGKLISERIPTPVAIPPYGTLELFVELNDASGGSGANFIIKWEAEAPVNPPLVEALHANMDGGKAVIFMTQSVPINEPAASPAR
jgi:hypothetical protein